MVESEEGSPRYGTLIAARRAELGLTREEVAEKVGLHPDGLGKIERGERRPKLETLERLADFYRCFVGDLMPKTLEAAPVPAECQGLLNQMSSLPEAARLYLLASFEQQVLTFKRAALTLPAVQPYKEEQQKHNRRGPNDEFSISPLMQQSTEEESNVGGKGFGSLEAPGSHKAKRKV